MPEEITAAERQQLEDAIAGRSPYPLRGPALRGRLAQLLLTDFSATPADKERALALVNEALGSVQSNDPLYPKFSHFKAAATRQVQGPSIDVIRARSEAVELDREAWRLSYDSAPKEALFFAQEWAEWAWASDFWEEVSDACELAHRALSRIVLRDSSGTDERFKLLVAYVSVGTRGAYAYVQLHRAKEALILLERVASLLSLANAQIWDLERLATEGHADLRDQILQLEHQASELQQQLGLDAFGNITPAERDALAQLDSVVAEVRKLPGYSSFAMPAGWNDIQAAAAETQLVYLAPTDKGCAIISVLPGARETWQVVVPTTRQEIYAAARGFIQSEFGAQRIDSTGPLVAMLEWLGAHLMGPLKSLLQNQGTKDDTPITIVPFDLLNWLPIHATFVRLPGPVASSFRIHYLFHPREVSLCLFGARSRRMPKTQQARPPAQCAGHQQSAPAPRRIRSIDLLRRGKRYSIESLPGRGNLWPGGHHRARDGGATEGWNRAFQLPWHRGQTDELRGCSAAGQWRATDYPSSFQPSRVFAAPCRSVGLSQWLDGDWTAAGDQLSEWISRHGRGSGARDILAHG